MKGQMMRVAQRLFEGSATAGTCLPSAAREIDAPDPHAHPLCKVCQGRDLTLLYRSQKYGFQVCRCASCRFVFVRNKISEQELRQMYSEDQGFQEFAQAMANEKVEARHRRALQEIKQALRMPLESDVAQHQPVLFDVGSGTGAFLMAAREAGFEVHGNEFSTTAIRMARETHRIELSSLAIEEDERSGYFDVITLWGVIEHALDPRGLLENSFRLLRSGGLLFAYTPVWCLYDNIALGFSRASLGHWTRLLDRRITTAHLQLFSQPVLERTLANVGFNLISSERVCEYNLHLAAYLESLGIPARARGGIAWALEQLIERGLFFRNNIRVLCRKRNR